MNPNPIDPAGEPGPRKALTLEDIAGLMAGRVQLCRALECLVGASRCFVLLQQGALRPEGAQGVALCSAVADTVTRWLRETEGRCLTASQEFAQADQERRE